MALHPVSSPNMAKVRWASPKSSLLLCVRDNGKGLSVYSWLCTHVRIFQKCVHCVFLGSTSSQQVPTHELAEAGVSLFHYSLQIQWFSAWICSLGNFHLATFL